MADPIELNYQYRRYREDTDAHFRAAADPYGCDDDCGDDAEAEDESMAMMADHADAADHLRRFVIQSAKKMGIPAGERDDVAGDALLEIAGDLGRRQFDLFLESVGMSDRIVDTFRESQRGLTARRAIKRVLGRFRFPQPTCTDIGFRDESDDEY